MGAVAVEMLLKGRSDIVMCEQNGVIVATDINYALALDKMYKCKLEDGDLDRFTTDEVMEMERTVRERRATMARLYGISKTINL